MNQTSQNSRLYAFAHSWLSSIQKGIQTSHMVAELCMNSTQDNNQKRTLEWFDQDKTIILLEGGNSYWIGYINQIVERNHYFSNASFCEDEDSMEGILTSVGIVLPEWFYGQKNEFAKRINNGMEQQHFFIEGTKEFKVSQAIWDNALDKLIKWDTQTIINLNQIILLINNSKLAC